MENWIIFKLVGEREKKTFILNFVHCEQFLVEKKETKKEEKSEICWLKLYVKLYVIINANILCTELPLSASAQPTDMKRVKEKVRNRKQEKARKKKKKKS